MKKLKNSLQFKLLIIIIILVLYSYIYDINYKSKFSNENVIYGYITNYYVYDDKVSIYLNSKEKIICNYKGKFNYKLGDYLRLEGNLENPSNNRIFNLFNYKKYLRYEHINYIFNVEKIDKIKDNNKIIYKIKNIIIDKINKSENKEYLYTFILGNTKYINKNVLDSYRINGISHLFSISGMHVSLISIILLKLFNKFRYKNLIVAFCILFYMFLTNFSPSILRAGIFFLLLLINKKYKLKISNVNLMLILLIICIIIDPFIIHKIGFQYSYIVSISLIKYTELIKRQKSKASKLLVISLISFLVSFPITVNNFYQVNILSIVFNLFFVPLVSTLLFPFTIISFIFPLNHLKYFISIFELISLHLSKIKLFIIVFSKINIFFVISYYIIAFYVLHNIEKKKYKKILIFFLFLIIHKSLPYLNFNTEITYLDVGQGDSIFIKSPNNKSNVLIDTGGNIYKDIYIDTKDYLNSQGITKLNYLILSHGDYDHMGEVINLVNNFKVEKVIFNCGEFNDLEKELIKVLDKKKIKYYSCIKELNIDKNKLYFLQTKVYDNENDNSNVIYTELNGYKFMFMGDASTTTEQEILNKYNLPGIDVLKVGHHGSKTSSSKEFIDEINPKYSVISVGRNNRYGHPNKEVLNNLEKSKIYRTDENGSIMFKIKNNKLKIEKCMP